MPPVYDYKCSVCGHVEEHFVKQSERDKVFYCEECNHQMDRQMGGVRAAGIRIKDGGRYSLDKGI